MTYVEDLQDGLARAEALTRAGELGPAMWAYLEVLEVDPDNGTARRQVGQVAAAVRQFDRTLQRRRWLQRMRRQVRFREWLSASSGEGRESSWLNTLLWVLLVLAALVIGYVFGSQRAAPPPAEGPTAASLGAGGMNGKNG